jgi:glutamate--cysteine ligase
VLALLWRALSGVFPSQHGKHLRDVQVPRTGLQTPFRDGTVLDVARQVLTIAKGGLERRGLDEVKFLGLLEKVAETGESSATKLLKLYETEWDGELDHLYKMMAF